MSFSQQSLPSGLYLFEKPVSSCDGYPFDLLSVRRDLPDPYQLQRYLDAYDVEVILETRAIRPIPPASEVPLPSRRWIRSATPALTYRRVASLSRSPLQ